MPQFDIFPLSSQLIGLFIVYFFYLLFIRRTLSIYMFLPKTYSTLILDLKEDILLEDVLKKWNYKSNNIVSVLGTLDFFGTSFAMCKKIDAPKINAYNSSIRSRVILERIRLSLFESAIFVNEKNKYSVRKGSSTWLEEVRSNPKRAYDRYGRKTYGMAANINTNKVLPLNEEVSNVEGVNNTTQEYYDKFVYGNLLFR